MENNNITSNQVINHVILLNNREICEICGIKKVESITENKILLETDLDYLCILGTNLEVLSLNTEKGELQVRGHIDVINYQKEKEKEIKPLKSKDSFLTKLFK